MDVKAHPEGGTLFSFSTELCLIGSTTMWDVVMLAIGLGFFLLSIGYALACDRL
jgi:hypothetical protein